MFNGKKTEYLKLVDVDLQKTCQECSTSFRDYEITFNFVPFQNRELDLSQDTIEERVNVSIGLRNTSTGEYIENTLEAMRFPVRTQLGFKVNGNLYEVQDQYRRACGWYLERKVTKDDEKRGDKGYTATFIPVTGKRFTIRVTNGVMLLCAKSDEEDKVPLVVALKAITGLSFAELMDKLGMSNQIVNRNFSFLKEPSLEEAITFTFKVFVNKDTMRKYNGDYQKQYAELRRILFGGKVITVDDTFDKRLAKTLSYENRIVGTTLYEDVELKDEVLKSGTIVDVKVAQKLDEAKIERVQVTKGRQIFDVRYYPTPKGLSENMFLNIVNTFAISYDGLDILDDTDEPYNKVVYSYNDIACENLKVILNKVVTSLKELVNTETLIESLHSVINSYMDQNVENKDSNYNKLEQVIKGYSESQNAEVINSIAIEAKSLVVTNEAKNRVSESARVVKKYELATSDPFAIPESGNVGLVNSRTLSTSVDEKGQTMSPFIKVTNGLVMDYEPVYLTPGELENKNIAMWNVDLKAETVTVLRNGEGVNVQPKDVDYLVYSPWSLVSITTGGIPFINHIDGKRVVMRHNQSKQSVFILGGERPIISTGMGGVFGIGVYTAEEILETYYHENFDRLVRRVSLEEFKKSTIYMTHARITGDYRILTFETYIGDNLEVITYPIPYMLRSQDNSIFTTRIVIGDKMFTGDEIVAYRCDVDIRPYKILGANENMEIDGHDQIEGMYKPNKFIDFGYLKPRKSFLKSELGGGTNIRCVFKSFEGTSIDDALTISEELRDNDILTSISAFKYEVELNEGEMFGVEEGSWDGNDSDYDQHLRKHGVPRVGDFVSQGQTIILRSVEKLGEMGKTYKVIPTVLKPIHEGQVISVDRKNKKAVVIIANPAKIRIGDKMAGSHGNKGVIANIVPEKDMPYDAETGIPYQICLNPLGVPSRMNVGQIQEAQSSECLDHEGYRAVISQFNSLDSEIVRELMEQSGCKPRILIDGKTGMPFDRPAQTGILYMYKLKHTADSKINQVGIPREVADDTGRPSEGPGGGQKIGEMESYVLAQSDSNHLIDYLFNMAVDTPQRQRKIEEYIQGNTSIEPDYNSDNDVYAQVLFRGCLYEMSTEEGKMVTRPLTSEVIKALNDYPVTKNGNQTSLQSEAIFGSDSGDSKSTEKFKYQWSYIDLHCEIPNPHAIEKGMLGKLIVFKEVYDGKDGETKLHVSEGKSNTLKDILEGRRFVNFNGPLPRISRTPRSGFTTGVSAVVSLLKNISIDECIYFYKTKTEKMPDNKKKCSDFFDLENRLRILECWKEQGVKFSDFVVDKYPVMPLRYRYNRTGDMMQRPDFDIRYERILTAVDKVKSTVINDTARNVYNRIGQLQGVVKDEGFSKNKIRNLMTHFSTREDNDDKKAIRAKMIATRVPFSGRTVIIPVDNYDMKLSEIGIPMFQITKILGKAIESYLEQTYTRYPRVRWKDVVEAIGSRDFITIRNKFESFSDGMTLKDAKDLYDEFFEVISKYVYENFPVMVGRQPTLHRPSWKTYNAVAVEGNAIKIHPLVCGAYNADFDGDQMHFEFIVEEKAAKDALNNHSVLATMIDLKDDSNLLAPTQDILIGLYYLTTLYRNNVNIMDCEEYKNVRFYTDVNQMIADIDCRFIDMHDLVVFTHKNGNKYFSTAGRIWFNSTVPGGFTDEPFENVLGFQTLETPNIDWEYPVINPKGYKKLRYDGLVAKKVQKKAKMTNGELFRYVSTGDIMKEVFESHSAEDVFEMAHAWKNLGMQTADRACISLTLDDFVQYPRKQEVVEKAQKLVSQIVDAYERGLMSESAKAKAVIKVYEHMQTYIRDDLARLLGRDNNLFMMADSGARGSIDNIMQICGLKGLLSKNSKEILQTAVLNNYIEGLTPMEHFLSSFGTRIGFVKQKLGVADSGEASRISTYLLEGLQVTSADCGNKLDEPILDLGYDKVKYIVRDELIGKRLAPQYSGYDDMTYRFGTDLITKEMANNIYSNQLNDIAIFERDGSVRVVKIDYGNSDLKVLVDQQMLISSQFEDELHDTESANKESKAYFELKGLLGRGRAINANTVEVIEKRKLPLIETFSGTYFIKYELKALFKSLLQNKLASGLPYLQSKNGDWGLISAKTIEHIEKFNLKRVKVRTLLTCSEKGGVCAKCYGRIYETKKFPAIGYRVGISAAQVVGESASQANLDAVNAGGKSGGASGLDRYKSMIGASKVSNGKAILSNEEGRVSCSEIGDNILLTLGEESHIVPRVLINVRDGEYVYRDDVLVNGAIDYNDIQEKVGDTEDSLRAVRTRQYLLLEDYYNIYGKNLGISARHFECYVRVQTSIVHVLKADSSSPIKAGQKCTIQEVKEAIRGGHSIQFVSNFAGVNEVCEVYGDKIKGIFFRNVSQKLANSFIDPTPFKPNSFITKLGIGQEQTSKEVKEMKTPEISQDVVTKEELAIEQTSTEVLEAVMEETPVIEDVNIEEIKSFDLGSILGNMSFDDKMKESPSVNEINSFSIEQTATESVVPKNPVQENETINLVGDNTPSVEVKEVHGFK